MAFSGFKFSELELSKYLRVWADVKFTDGLCRGRPVCAPREIHPRAWTRDLLGDGRYLRAYRKGNWEERAESVEGIFGREMRKAGHSYL